jgi:hypothetical protein
LRYGLYLLRLVKKNMDLDPRIRIRDPEKSQDATLMWNEDPSDWGTVISLHDSPFFAAWHVVVLRHARTQATA